MSSDVTLDELKSMNAKYYLSLISFTILVHDYCLTFVAEVETFWRVGQLNWASGFFYLNRYLTLFGHVPVMLEYFWTTSEPNKYEICRRLQSFHQYLAIMIQIVVACMLIMRMYALYGRSRKVLVFYIITTTVIVVVGGWTLLGGKKEKPRIVRVRIGCGVNLSREKAIRLGAAWGGMLIFDSLVFCMTLYKSIISWPSRDGEHILSILLRDGAIYFGVMMVANLANILTFMLGGSFTRGVATMFTNIISSVMISRLMLNLRRPSHAFNRKSTSFAISTSYNPDLTSVDADYTTQVPERTPSPGLDTSRPGRAGAV